MGRGSWIPVDCSRHRTYKTPPPRLYARQLSSYETVLEWSGDNRGVEFCDVFTVLS